MQVSKGAMNLKCLLLKKEKPNCKNYIYMTFGCGGGGGKQKDNVSEQISGCQELRKWRRWQRGGTGDFFKGGKLLCMELEW
jgi:hypothetical protein